jgi:Helix-turn-helix domain
MREKYKIYVWAAYTSNLQILTWTIARLDVFESPYEHQRLSTEIFVQLNLNNSAGAAAPITITIAKAREISGLGNTTLYALIRGGELKTTTVGKRRLVFFESLMALLEKYASWILSHYRTTQNQLSLNRLLLFLVWREVG